MNRFFLLPAFIAALFITGCGGDDEAKDEKDDKDSSASNDAGKDDAGKDDADSDADNDKDAGAGKGDAGDKGTGGDGFALTSENTTIAFIGTHVGAKPDPRNGSFKSFTGSISVDGDKISAIAIDIDTTSVSTTIEKLTNHLKSPDFFDVRQFPKASFKSSSVNEAEGKITVTGDLTLLDVTKEISFPATATVADGKVTLNAAFEIDRTEFGMTFGDNVEKKVAMTVTVGG